MTITVYAIHSYSPFMEFCGVKATAEQALDFVKECMHNDCDLPGYPTEPTIETTSSGLIIASYPDIEWNIEPCTIDLP